MSPEDITLTEEIKNTLVRGAGIFERLHGGYPLKTRVGSGHSCHETWVHSSTDTGDFRIAAFNCQKQGGNDCHRRMEGQSENQGIWLSVTWYLKVIYYGALRGMLCTQLTVVFLELSKFKNNKQ